MNDVRDMLKDHGGRLETLERRIDDIDDDPEEIHEKAQEERDERAEQRAILAPIESRTYRQQ